MPRRRFEPPRPLRHVEEARAVVAVPAQFANYYWGWGDLMAVLALAVVLLLRPTGLMGVRKA